MNRGWNLVETLLRRYPWVLTLLVLIPCAWFDALGVNHLIAQSLFKADTATLIRPIPLTPAQRDAANKPPPSFRSRDLDGMLRRNAFDSASGSLLPTGPAPGAQAAAAAQTHTQVATQPLAPGQKALPEPCDTPAKVLGAIESDHPEWSMLLVSMGSTPNASPMLRRVGQVLDTKPIREIGWHPRVGAYALFWVEENGPRCYLAQFMPPRPPPPPVAAAPQPAAPAVPGGDALVSMLDRIVSTGPNEFATSRGVVDELLKNQHLFMRQMRVNPVDVGGKIMGLQMFGVSGSSLLGKLGMQQGDILSRINGLEISSPDKALEAYSRLRTSDRITLSLTRNNQPLNIDINIKAQ